MIVMKYRGHKNVTYNVKNSLNFDGRYVSSSIDNYAIIWN